MPPCPGRDGAIPRPSMSITFDLRFTDLEQQIRLLIEHCERN